MQLSNYEVEVLVNGKTVKEYAKDGLVYIEGRKQTPYAIKIKNNSHKRILAVPTVDGLSVIDGKPATFKSRGYIVDPYSAVTIDGWRISHQEVAKFIFSDVEKSYAANQGDSAKANCGIIGVAIFEEKFNEYQVLLKRIDDDWREIERNWPKKWPNITWYDNISTTLPINTQVNAVAVYSHSGTNCCSKASNVSYHVADYNVGPQAPEKFDLGTGWGESKRSETNEQSFERATEEPLYVFTLRYASRTSLEALGLDLRGVAAKVEPNPFPGEFCQPPKK